MPGIIPFLWFDGGAEEAANFYLSIFKDGRIDSITRRGGSGPVATVTVTLQGQQLIAFDGGPHFSFTPAISMFVTCQTQQEVDEYWDKLTTGGEAHRCGWLKDKYGLSWQIVPAVLGEMLQDKDAARANRVMQTMMTMIKIDIAGLRRAADATNTSDREKTVER